MSLINNFKNNKPLNVPKLEYWLELILGKLDKDFEIEASVLMNLYNQNENAIITGMIDVDAIVDAIQNGKNLRTNMSASILAGKCTVIESDDYKNFKIYVIGALDGTNIKKVMFEVESLMGDVRLCTKTVSEV